MLKQFIIISIIYLLSSSEAKQWVEVNSSDSKKSSFTHQSNGLSSTEISDDNEFTSAHISFASNPVTYLNK